MRSINRQRDGRYLKIRLVKGIVPISDALTIAAGRRAGQNNELYNDETVVNSLVFDMSPDLAAEALYGSKRRGLRRPLQNLCSSCGQIMRRKDFLSHNCANQGLLAAPHPLLGSISAKELDEIRTLLPKIKCPGCGAIGYTDFCSTCGCDEGY